MTDNELQIVKERISHKNQLNELKKQILVLQQDPKVKEYFSLVQQLEEMSKTDKVVTISREHSNNLLFKYGRFSIRIYEDSYPSIVCIYRDLETEEYFYYTECYEFKNIKRSSIQDRKELEKLDVEFEKMREFFFEQLLDKPQQEVVWEMFENNKQLVKGKKHELLF